MTKFMKIVVNGASEYFNASNITSIEKSLPSGVTQIEVMYSSLRTPNFKIQQFATAGKAPSYIVDAINRANSTSHTDNVYIPELRQGAQPIIDNVT
jgi:hypothetical protein